MSIVPGLGQVYVGYYRVGFTHIITILSLIALAATEAVEEISPAFVFFALFFWLHGIIDAGRRAAHYNHALRGGAGIDLPSGLPSGEAPSIGSGMALIVIGVVLLSHTAFDQPLEWLRDWWPLGPIGVGVYFVMRGVIDRAVKQR